jgi:hypothetical protein
MVYNQLKFIDVFCYIDTGSCILYVPAGSKDAYQKAVQWKDFKNIVEMSGISISTNHVNIASKGGSIATVDLSSDINWSASSDQTWLSLSPSSGIGNTTLILTAEANTTSFARTTIITISALGKDENIVTVTQEAGTQTGLTVAIGKEVSIYPSPVQDRFTIRGFEGTALYVLYDISGRKLLSGQLIEGTYISASYLSKGTYLLKISTNTGVIGRKIIKE